ncbi:MAG TPA: hypothetical protein PKM63_05200 [Panacibacter sp.]|nr:hypothetical protein [Panacibacter sp.]HNP43658.1 hypothetical protein [Panacibacter sp.]
MANLGKKILAAFVEVTDEEPTTVAKQLEVKQLSTSVDTVQTRQKPQANNTTTEKFKQYFDQLFKDANLPGPDYFEFCKMTEAMQAILDEKARYSAAFAGLSVQGLDKQKLLNTAASYLKILETDANSFDSTVDAALKEKVQGKQQEIEAKQKRIADISREITDLQHQIQLLQHEVRENEERIESNSGGYKAASENMKEKILYDIEKIKQHIV